MRWALFILAFFFLPLSACSGDISSPSPPLISSLSEGEIEAIVWQTLEPNTSSHDQGAWEIVEMRSVTGGEIQDLFEGEPVPGNCVPGPKPPENQNIASNASYWYVLMKPLSVTSEPVPTEQYSPTAPPRVPEPFLFEAHFLVAPNSGEVVARKLYCVIY